jgi:4-amino-4-deoxy-L-arabinose transferase-like glycosyltransferase
VPGLKEILLISLVILALFYLPRAAGNRGKNAKVSRTRVSGSLRLAILATALWPLLAALFFEPWQGRLLPFLYLGIGPVFAAWSAAWVFFGFRKK